MPMDPVSAWKLAPFTSCTLQQSGRDSIGGSESIVQAFTRSACAAAGEAALLAKVSRDVQ